MAFNWMNKLIKKKRAKLLTCSEYIEFIRIAPTFFFSYDLSIFIETPFIQRELLFYLKKKSKRLLKLIKLKKKEEEFCPHQKFQISYVINFQNIKLQFQILTG